VELEQTIVCIDSGLVCLLPVNQVNPNLLNSIPKRCVAIVPNFEGVALVKNGLFEMNYFSGETLLLNTRGTEDTYDYALAEYDY
jgi:hypothetical protein